MVDSPLNASLNVLKGGSMITPTADGINLMSAEIHEGPFQLAAGCGVRLILVGDCFGNLLQGARGRLRHETITLAYRSGQSRSGVRGRNSELTQGRSGS